MSRSSFPALDAITFQLLATLERYEEDVSRLALRWSQEEDMDLYAQVSRHVDDLRMYCASQPQVTVQWVTLLISHTELMHALWRISQKERGVALAEHLQDHADCIRSLATKCRRLLRERGGLH